MIRYMGAFLEDGELKLDNFHWQFIEQPKWVKVWIDRTSKMTDKTKHMMTRQEAIELFKKHTPLMLGQEKIIDFYIEAGMLEIKEEEQIIIQLQDIHGHTHSIEAAEIKTRLFEKGFLIVSR